MREGTREEKGKPIDRTGVDGSERDLALLAGCSGGAEGTDDVPDAEEEEGVSDAAEEEDGGDCGNGGSCDNDDEWNNPDKDVGDTNAPEGDSDGAKDRELGESDGVANLDVEETRTLRASSP